MFGSRKTPPPPPGSGLVIGPRDLVQGTVKAQTVTVTGRFDGQLEAETTLLVAAGGALTGTVAARRLVVEPGAVVRATCRVGLPAPDAAAPGAGAATPPRKKGDVAPPAATQGR